MYVVGVVEMGWFDLCVVGVGEDLWYDGGR